ncbi:hypothetical protein [Pediococcus pentosaceus]|uniref:hypothetical protein n=1 Tax=Pediococcus pentosaceus TaxID=1255 RepID=UPI002016C7C8|nr:hypothetical protein [Pediococcus pentosaceus]MCL3858858.1 hypothetical protein [Pediococcus pentosaceus]
MKKYFYVLIAVLVFAVIACYIVTLKSGDTVVSNTKTKTAITRIVDRKESGKLKKKSLED